MEMIKKDDLEDIINELENDIAVETKIVKELKQLIYQKRCRINYIRSLYNKKQTPTKKEDKS